MISLSRRWLTLADDWLTAPGPNGAGNLCLFRILYALFYLWQLSQQRAEMLEGAPEALTRFVILVAVLPGDLPLWFFGALESCLVGSLLMLLVGFRVRAATVLTLAFGITLEGLYSQLDPENATSFLVAFIPFFMAISNRWGDLYSVDAHLQSMSDGTRIDPQNDDWTYSIAMRANLVILAWLFFGGFLAKIGPDGTWLYHEDLIKNLVLEKNVHSAVYGFPGFPFAYWISETAGVHTAMRYGALAFEALFPLVLLGGRIGRVIIAIALLFHAFNAIWFAVSFTPILIVYGLFVDWQSVLQRLPRLGGPSVSAAWSVGLALTVVVGGALTWNSPMSLRYIVCLGGLIDFRTIFYPVVPLSIAMVVASLVEWPVRGRPKKQGAVS